MKGRFLRRVEKIYEETWCEVITEEGISKSLRTEVGVRQGCPLSPTMFNLFIEDIDETWAKKNIGDTVVVRKFFARNFLLLTLY